MDSNNIIRITQSAKKDIEKIIYYLRFELYNDQAALTFITKLTESFNNLELFPNHGNVIRFEFFEDVIIRRIKVKNYSLYYCYIDNVITILRVIYSKCDTTNLFQ